LRISVNVKPNSRESKIEKKGENVFLVYVKSPPHENRANQELIEIISEHFNVPKKRISIVAGFRSKNKILEIK
jgi:uncharacterized protein (TIGR00251 family)